MLTITRTSILSGTTRSRDMDITTEQWFAYKGGKLVQDAFPHLSADDCEFILTGITPDEWEATFGAPE